MKLEHFSTCRSVDPKKAGKKKAQYLFTCVNILLGMIVVRNNQGLCSFYPVVSFTTLRKKKKPSCRLLTAAILSLL